MFETSSITTKSTRDCLKAAEFCNGDVEFSLDNTEYKFADHSRNQLLINFKRLIGLKITLVKFKYPEGETGRCTLYPLSSLSVSSDILFHTLTLRLTLEVVHIYLECSDIYLAKSKEKEGNLEERCKNVF